MLCAVQSNSASANSSIALQNLKKNRHRNQFLTILFYKLFNLMLESYKKNEHSTVLCLQLVSEEWQR